MNFRQKYVAFISAFICSGIIMSAVGGAILGFQRPQKAEINAQLYTAPPPEDGCCFVGLEADGKLMGYYGIYLNYKAKTAYIAWLSADCSLPEPALCTFIDIGIFSRLVDNCNGVIYTKDGKSHMIMGKDIAEAAQNGQATRAAALAAAFFGKVLKAEYIDLFQQYLADSLSRRGNLSIAHWLQRKEAIKSIGGEGKIIDISQQSFAALLYKE